MPESKISFGRLKLAKKNRISLCNLFKELNEIVKENLSDMETRDIVIGNNNELATIRDENRNKERRYFNFLNKVKEPTFSLNLKNLEKEKETRNNLHSKIVQFFKI